MIKTLLFSTPGPRQDRLIVLAFFMVEVAGIRLCLCSLLFSNLSSARPISPIAHLIREDKDTESGLKCNLRKQVGTFVVL